MMFNNPGGKLKVLAKIIFWIDVLAGFAGAVVMFFLDLGALSFLLALACIAAGFLLGWLSSIGLYAFGELCEDTSVIRRNSENTTPAAPSYPSYPAPPVQQHSGQAADLPEL